MNPTAHTLFCEQMKMLERATMDKVQALIVGVAGHRVPALADLRDVFKQEEKTKRTVIRALIVLEQYTSK